MRRRQRRRQRQRRREGHASENNDESRNNYRDTWFDYHKTVYYAQKPNTISEKNEAQPPNERVVQHPHEYNSSQHTLQRLNEIKSQPLNSIEPRQFGVDVCKNDKHCNINDYSSNSKTETVKSVPRTPIDIETIVYSNARHSTLE